MKLRIVFIAIVLLTYIAPARSAPPNPTDRGLELQLRPGEVHNGVPRTLTILLINRSKQDVSLPLPAMEYGDAPHGTVRLLHHFIPLKGVEPSEELSAGISDYFYQPILERVKSWKLLRSGESLSLGLVNDRVIAGAVGRYDYWAEYDPPEISEADEVVLQKAGINFHKGNIESPHVRFVKRR